MVSAVTLRVVIVVGGVVLLGLLADRMMVVVLPVIIAMLMATLLAPLAGWLQRHRLGRGPAAFLAVALAFLVFLGLWGLVIPPFVSQVPEVIDNVHDGRRAGRGGRRAARRVLRGRPGRHPAGARAAPGRAGGGHRAHRGAC